jgi:NhaA family Na+:H+ antiporter
MPRRPDRIPMRRPVSRPLVRPAVELLAAPVRRFLEVEAAGGLLLFGATVMAVAWANSPWRHSYIGMWDHHLSLTLFGYQVHSSYGHAVNDGLMTVFFFVVGLEIKREWVAGELRDRRAAALPALAALGGMVVPALLFVVVTAGGDGARGWGIPMATDIAFAVGVVAALGSRVPSGLKLFLLTLAIVDDIGAIVVIAVFYASDLRWAWIVTAMVLTGVVVVLRRTGVRRTGVYVLVGVALWFATWRSGVHATVAGVALGLLTPAAASDSAESVAARIERRLHPWSSYLIIPLFALANAGVALGSGFEGTGARVLVGVVVGLLAGKTIGVVGATWLAVRAGVGDLPDGVSWRQVVGMALLAGIGFTMSLFVTDLAFAGPDAGSLARHAKVGVLGASVVAAAVGAALLWRPGRDAAESAGR